MGLGRNWTKDEENYLSDNFGMFSYQTLAKNLNRSVSAIKNKTVRLGLGSMLDQGDYVTWNQLLANLGYAQSTNYKKISWIENRNFPIHTKKVDKSSFKIVYIDEFWKWAELNQDLLDFSKFEENVLGAEPSWVKLKRKRDFETRKKIKKTPWTSMEDADLIRLVEQHRYTYPELSARLNRTNGAIQRRLVELKIKDRPVKVNNHISWSSEDIQLLSDLIKQGYGYELMADKIGRSSKAIRGFVYRYYATENLDKVRRYIGTRVFGDNLSEKR